MNVISANKEWLVKNTVAYTSGIYAALSMVALWVDFTSFLSGLSPFLRVLVSLGVLVCITLICFVASFLYLRIKKRFTVFKSETGHSISIQFGNILDSSIHSIGNRLISIVIPVNRCFDTMVDDKLIAKSSLHGAFITSLVAKNSFSPESLNQQIQQSLKDEPYDTLLPADKPRGNLKRFRPGTVVNIEAGDLRYFLLGLSSFNKDLKAITSKEDYTIAIQKLLEYCDSNAQGGGVFLPLIGTGLSRVGVSKNDALSYLYHTIVLNKEHLSFDITILVPDSERGNISISNYK